MPGRAWRRRAPRRRAAAAASSTSTTIAAAGAGRAGRSARRPGSDAARPASARATATRWAWPPEISSGSLSASSPRSSAGERRARPLARAARRVAPSSTSGSATFSSTVSGGSRLGPWKTTPTGPGRRSLARADRRPARPCPCVGRVEAGHEVQQRRLARARRADERDPVARRRPRSRSARSATVAAAPCAVGAARRRAQRTSAGAHGASLGPLDAPVAQADLAVGRGGDRGVVGDDQHRAARAARDRAGGRGPARR